MFTFYIISTGPKNCEIFQRPTLAQTKLSDVVLQRNKQMQDDILNLLNEQVSRPTDILKHQVTKRCQALASFMESIMDEVNLPDLKLDLPQESEMTASERDSVMLGEISPHHEYYDSKSSSETPPSYTQLNYNDNLLRFFNSHPKTLIANDDLNKLDGSVELSPNQRFEESGDSRSAEDYSMGIYNLMGNVGKNQYASFTPNAAAPILTEASLDRHNDDMEKGMVKKHKELSRSVRNFKEEKLKKQAKEALYRDIHTDVQLGHGVKRSGSLSWEADTLQNHKHQHLADKNKTAAKAQTSTHNTRNVTNLNDFTGRSTRINPQELWPQFPMSIPICGTQSLLSTNPELSMTNILPGILSGKYLYPGTDVGHIIPQEHQVLKPIFVNGYHQPHTSLIFPPHPLISNSIPNQSFGSTFDENLLPNEGKSPDAAATENNKSEPSGVSLKKHNTILVKN